MAEIRSKAVKFLSLAGVLCSCIGNNSPYSRALTQDTAATYPGVVRIKNKVSNKVGAGFIIKLDRDSVYIVTAAHILHGTNDPEIRFFPKSDQAFIGLIKKNEIVDEKRDLSLVVVMGDLPPGIRELKLDQSDITDRDSDPLTIIGFPNQDNLWRSFRITSPGQDATDLLLDKTNIHDGMSGGPVILKGQVVGMITHKNDIYGYARPAKIIQSFVEGSMQSLLPGSRPGPLGAHEQSPRDAPAKPPVVTNTDSFRRVIPLSGDEQEDIVEISGENFYQAELTPIGSATAYITVLSAHTTSDKRVIARIRVRSKTPAGVYKLTVTTPRGSTDMEYVIPAQ